MIANFAVFTVNRQWHNLFSVESTWTIILILLGLVLGIVVAYIYKDAVYDMVLIWAYSGILIKHMSANGFNRQYPMIIVAVIGSLALLILLLLYILLINKKDTD